VNTDVLPCGFTGLPATAGAFSGLQFGSNTFSFLDTIKEDDFTAHVVTLTATIRF
jgi:hypothetical protein